MVIIDRKVKQVFKSFQASMSTVMRARLASERRVKTQKIKTIKATLKAIDTALERPGSRPALRRLKAVRSQVVELLEQEVRDLTKRMDASKRMLARFRNPRFPFLKP